MSAKFWHQDVRISSRLSQSLDLNLTLSPNWIYEHRFPNRSTKIVVTLVFFTLKSVPLSLSSAIHSALALDLEAVGAHQTLNSPN